MSEMTFNAIIGRLLDENISISLSKDDGVGWFDLNTGMKSHLHISEGENGRHKYRQRYGITGEFETFDDLVRIASSCRCGRDYVNEHWDRLLSTNL